MGAGGACAKGSACGVSVTGMSADGRNSLAALTVRTAPPVRTIAMSGPAPSLRPPRRCGQEIGELLIPGMTVRRVPEIVEGEALTLIDALTGENYVFTDPDKLAHFKYQRYMMRYLQTIQCVDDNVGRLLDYLDSE